MEITSGNIYAGIEVKTADEMLAKTRLAATIQGILHSRNLAQTQTAEILGLPQPKLSRPLHGHFRGVSKTKMMDCIARLGHNVRIVIGPEHSGQAGSARVAEPFSSSPPR